MSESRAFRRFPSLWPRFGRAMFFWANPAQKKLGQASVLGRKKKLSMHHFWAPLEDWIVLYWIGLGATYREVNFSAVRAVPPLSGQLRKRHSRPHRQLLGAHAAELHDGEEEQKQTTEKARNLSSERRRRGRRGIGPSACPSHADRIQTRRTATTQKARWLTPLREGSPRHVPEKRGSCSIVPTWRSKRSTSLADATLDASLPSSKAPSAHRSRRAQVQESCGTGAAGSHRLHTQDVGSLRSHTHRSPLPAHTSSKHPRARSHAQHRPARRGGSDSQREKKGTRGHTRAHNPARHGQNRKKERGVKEEKRRGKRERREGKGKRGAAKQTPHTHTHTPGGAGARNKNKRQERLPQLPPDARPEPNTNRSRNGKNQPAGTVTLAEPFEGREGGALEGFRALEVGHISRTTGPYFP